MKKTIRACKAWAIINPYNSVLSWTIGDTRAETISNVNRENLGRWDVWKDNGYRIRRITITVED